MSARGSPRFEVWITAHPPGGEATRTRRSGHHAPRLAIGAVCDVLKQWAASEGAITPGTIVSIVDTNDGGQLLTMQYLGFEAKDLLGSVATWPGTQRPVRTSRPAWPM